MANAIQRDLRRAEQRESQLWMLALGLLGFLGIILLVHYLSGSLSETGSSLWSSSATLSTATRALFFLVPLFCLYVFHVYLRNRRMMSLLLECSRMAASGRTLDSFLPSIAREMAEIASADTCRIALFGQGQSRVQVRACLTGMDTDRQPELANSYELHCLPACRRAVATKMPVVLDPDEVDDLWGEERALFGADRHELRTLLVIPMNDGERTPGVIVLGRAKGVRFARFSPSIVATSHALARHAAAAVDEARLKLETSRDPLTGLYARRHFGDRLKAAIHEADRNDQTLGVLLCDLDRFHRVNDSGGHRVGDDALKAIARSIQQSTRGSDLVFRWGGDEIVAILSDSSKAGAMIAAERIRTGVCRTPEAGRFGLDVSVGLAFYPEHGRNEEQLIRTADRALHIAKQGDEKIHAGDEEYKLDRNSVKVVFQPVMDVLGDRVLGYEALSRDPQGKLSAFGLFEKYQALGRLGELKRVAFLSQLRLASELGLERLFINVDFDLLGRLGTIPKPEGLEVVLELSEREALHNLEQHLEIAQSWHARGYKFAVDDFGAGFISFPFLSMLVPEYVKVDRSTMLQAVSSDQFRRFLGSLLGAVRTYATSGIIAEGVEKESELRVVKEMGISLVQGYLFGRPEELTPSTVNARTPSLVE